MNEINRILVLAPHTDDAEFGCGGSMDRFVKEGKEVYCISFASATPVNPDILWTTDLLKTETKEATKRLSIPEKNVTIYDFKIRELGYQRQEILEEMIRIKRDINPDMIFIPSTHDIHQDHITISQEGLRAFKGKTLFGYEVPWNNITFQSSAFIILSEENIKQKIYALGAYESQKGRHFIEEHFVRGIATMRGAQLGYDYAESFEVIRWVLQ